MKRSAQEYVSNINRVDFYDAVVKTDLNFLPKLSKELGNHIYLKREDQQPVKSFKLRGAYNKLLSLSEQEKEDGVVAASAGNHAQGVAFAANKMGVHATIVMPETTPEIKVDAVRGFGGEYANVVLHGSNFDTAGAEAKRLADEEGLTPIHPFDDPDTIVGQGTIAKELLEQNPDLDILFIAVGGGGLAAGIAAYIKTLRPDIKIIAVESDESACLKAAFDEGHRVELPTVGIFADGVAVKLIGEETYRILKDHVDEVITVTTDEICAGIKDIFDDTRVIAEPAGALSIAGIRKYLNKHPKIQNANIGGILCGANINFHTLRYVSERCELGEGKEAIIAVKIPEEKGAFRNFCEVLQGRAITEFNYRYSNDNEAHIFVGIRLREGLQELQQIAEQLAYHDYQWFDLSRNELAKLHVRYMVGGRPPSLLDEHLFSFEFPEAPGALLKFLTTLGDSWNITLFHYRNHGAAEGLVLAGFDIPEQERDDFDDHLRQLNYQYEEASDNPAYQFFLSGKNSPI
jgi:threonine dehydratase